MEQAPNEVHASIDRPQEDELVSTRAYTFRIKAPLNAERVDVSIDGGPWARCRYASGCWWFDWSEYESGPHEAAARIRPFDSRGYILRTRRFSVALEPRPEERLARHAARQFTVLAPNQPGALAGILSALCREGISYSCLLGLNVGTCAAIQFVAEEADVEERLARSGFKTSSRPVLALELSKRSSDLNRLARLLGQSDINILTLFGTARGEGLDVVVAVDQPASAVPAIGHLLKRSI